MRIPTLLIATGLLILGTVAVNQVVAEKPATSETTPKTVAGRTVDQYAQQLSDTNRVVRLRAVKSLGAFGKAAGEALTTALASDDPAVQYTAAVHLGRIAGEPLKSASEQITKLVEQKESLPVRMAAAYALCRSGKVDAHLVVLIEALEYPERGVACSAAELIGMLGANAKPAIEPLEAMHAKHKSGVKGGDYHRGGAAMNALRKIRGE